MTAKLGTVCDLETVPGGFWVPAAAKERWRGRRVKTKSGGRRGDVVGVVVFRSTRHTCAPQRVSGGCVLCACVAGASVRRQSALAPREGGGNGDEHGPAGVGWALQGGMYGIQKRPEVPVDREKAGPQQGEGRQERRAGGRQNRAWLKQEHRRRRSRLPPLLTAPTAAAARRRRRARRRARRQSCAAAAPRSRRPAAPRAA